MTDTTAHIMVERSAYRFDWLTVATYSANFAVWGVVIWVLL